MGTFWKAFFGGFFGKVFASLFLAACLLLGFGPDEWAKFVIQDLPWWFTPDIARHILIFLGLMTVIYLYLSFERKAKPILEPEQIYSVSDNVYCETRYVQSSLDQDTGFMENVFYLVIGNMQDSGQMLKQVQARIFFAGTPTLCCIKDSMSDAIDIRHGELVYFEIGKLVSKEIMGTVNGPAVISESEIEIYNHNIPLGELSFEVYSIGHKKEYGLGHSQNDLTVWPISMVISADDEKSKTVNININMTKTKSPVKLANKR